MGLRETINQKPSMVTGVTVGVMVVALAVIVYQQRSNRPPERAPGERPVYVPATQDRPVDTVPAEPRKGAATPGRAPGRAAAPRLRKIFAGGGGAAAAAKPSAVPSPVNTPESIA